MAEQSKYIKQTPVVEAAALKGGLEEAEEAEVEDMAEEDVVVLVEVVEAMEVGTLGVVQPMHKATLVVVVVTVLETTTTVVAVVIIIKKDMTTGKAICSTSVIQLCSCQSVMH
nr:uncharacterized protein LOC131791316 isoform X2 [Pocillopora verrucosa]